MSIVIVGGNDCMVRQYKDLCAEYDCQAKVFTQVPKGFRDKIGTPDMMVLFTHTVSHKMVQSALIEAKRKKVKVIRSHTSSSHALRDILTNHAV